MSKVGKLQGAVNGLKRIRRQLGPLIAVAVVGIAFVPAARAQGPGRWLLTGASSVPVSYWQGLTSPPDKSSSFFTGFAEGLWRTTPTLAQTAGVANAIPAAVRQAEGYNHIGDPSWDP